MIILTSGILLAALLGPRASARQGQLGGSFSDRSFAGRGVYVSRFRSDGGSRVLVALDRCGCLVAHVVVRNDAEVPPVADMLRDLLNRLDPPLRCI